MSIAVMSYVWKHSKHKGSELLTLLAIADFTDDDGTNAYPSLPVLAQKTRLTARNVQLVLKKLEASHELHVTPNTGKRGRNLFTILMGEKISGEKISPEKISGEKISPEKISGEIQCQTGVKSSAPPSVLPLPQSPSPSLSPPGPDPSLDPSEKRERAREETSFLEPGDLSAFHTFEETFTASPRGSMHARCQEVLAHLTRTTGLAYETSPHIAERLRAGHTVQDCCRLIDWLDVVMRVEDPDWVHRWFNNATPFKEEQFDKYNARARQWAEEGRPAPRASPQGQTRYGDPRISDKGLYNLQSTNVLLQKYGVRDDEPERPEGLFPRLRPGG